MKRIGILRVSAAQEHLGLNFGEHMPGIEDEHINTVYAASKGAPGKSHDLTSIDMQVQGRLEPP